RSPRSPRHRRRDPGRTAWRYRRHGFRARRRAFRACCRRVYMRAARLTALRARRNVALRPNPGDRALNTPLAIAVNLERAAVAGDAETVRRSHGVTRSTRSNVALRLARIALREGRAPTVRVARGAIAYCAFSAEHYGDAGAA